MPPSLVQRRFLLADLMGFFFLAGTAAGDRADVRHLSLVHLH